MLCAASQNLEQKREEMARAAIQVSLKEAAYVPVGEVDKLRDEIKGRNAAYDTNIAQVTADTKAGRFVLYFVAFAMIYLVTVRKH